MVAKTITLKFISNDKDAFRIEQLIRSASAEIVEENGGKGIKVNSEVEFLNQKKEYNLKIPKCIGK